MDTQPLSTDRSPITVRLEFQLRKGQDAFGPEILGICKEIEQETGQESCDSGTGFMTDPPTRDWGWEAHGKAAAEFIAHTISSVMERRGWTRGDFNTGGYMVTLFDVETSKLTTFGE